MAFQGYGSQANQKQARSGGASGDRPFAFGYSEMLPGDRRYNLGMFSLPRGVKDREVIILDDIKSVDDPMFAALVHQFWYNGRPAALTSLEGIDERGCPIAHALRTRRAPDSPYEPKLASAVWLLTVLEMTPYTYTAGPNKGKTVNSRRSLLAVPRGRVPNSKVSRVEEFTNFATKIPGGLRLQVFQVSRGEGDRSPKIGSWWPTHNRRQIHELREQIAADAELYGFATADDYLAPVNYHEVVKPRDYDYLKRAAAFIEADRRTSKSAYDRLDDEPTTSHAPAHGTPTAEIEDEGAVIPF